MGRMGRGAQFGDCKLYTVHCKMVVAVSTINRVHSNYDDVKYSAPRQSDSCDACETGQSVSCLQDGCCGGHLSRGFWCRQPRRLKVMTAN
jgi:hypothetical protein